MNWNDIRTQQILKFDDHDKMNSDSAEAYDLPKRVRTYDSDMDIMHPLRDKMIEVALKVLPFDQTQALTALDLGIGTGVFSKQLLENYPNSQVVGIDGAIAMKPEDHKIHLVLIIWRIGDSVP